MKKTNKQLVILSQGPHLKAVLNALYAIPEVVEVSIVNLDADDLDKAMSTISNVVKTDDTSTQEGFNEMLKTL